MIASSKLFFGEHAEIIRNSGTANRVDFIEGFYSKTPGGMPLFARVLVKKARLSKNSTH
jgi:hypothetical protein